MEIKSLQEALEILDTIKAEFDSNSEKGEKYLEKTFAYGCGGKRFPFGIWFRGENNYNFKQFKPLTPTMFRSKDKEEEDYFDETSIFNLMPTRIPKLSDYNSYVDKLSTMQHYGIPTRLLDWSESLLVGLYFACSSSFDLDSSLFVLNARKLNLVTGNENSIRNLHMENDYGTKFRCEFINVNNGTNWYKKLDDNYPEYNWEWVDKYKKLKDTAKMKFNLDVINGHSTPVAIVPKKINQRMIMQSSVFTLHGGKITDNVNGFDKNDDFIDIPNPVNLLDLPNKDNFLLRYTIKKENKEKIKSQLFSIGIHESSLFPEIEKQSTYLKIIY